MPLGITYILIFDKRFFFVFVVYFAGLEDKKSKNEDKCR
jgi:hypothetical protein